MGHNVVSDLPTFVPVGDDSWMSSPRRHCKGEDPELFFPKAGPKREVLDICAGCPVRKQCLRWALDNNEVGIWGGTTYMDRARMLDRRIGRDRHR